MKKIRTLSFGIVIAAGMAMFGTGVAAAEDAPLATTQPEVGGTEEEATTGSAAGLAALIQALTTGSAAAEETPVETAPAS